MHLLQAQIPLKDKLIQTRAYQQDHEYISVQMPHAYSCLSLTFARQPRPSNIVSPVKLLESSIMRLLPMGAKNMRITNLLLTRFILCLTKFESAR